MRPVKSHAWPWRNSEHFIFSVIFGKNYSKMSAYRWIVAFVGVGYACGADPLSPSASTTTSIVGVWRRVGQPAPSGTTTETYTFTGGSTQGDAMYVSQTLRVSGGCVQELALTQRWTLVGGSLTTTSTAGTVRMHSCNDESFNVAPQAKDASALRVFSGEVRVTLTPTALTLHHADRDRTYARQ